MRATAEASPNIALVKYWGKRDVERNLPSTGSLSITLDSLKTRMTVELDDVLPADTLLVNDIPAAGMLPRVSACLDQLLGADRATARLSSYGNFPIAAGLASSAAAFAALVVAASAAAGQRRDRLDLARVAGAASGSAARSLYGGFVELKNTIDDIAVASFVDPGDWPLQVIVAINAAGEKSVSSGEAMRRSAATSPFYQSWVRQQDRQVLAARRAVEARDFEQLGEVAEHNCLKMHSVMWSTRPAIVYWNAATIASMETVRQLRADGIPVFFTIDAGPQVKAVCEPAVAEQVRQAIAATPGVIDTLQTGLGVGARQVAD